MPVSKIYDFHVRDYSGLNQGIKVMISLKWFQHASELENQKFPGKEQITIIEICNNRDLL